MKTNRVLAVIPARYASTRFPGKPLAPIAGKPMVAHVVARAHDAGCFDEVLVATDDERIARAAAAAGARPVLTGECRSGTDRVALAVKGEDGSVIVNVQGDEPALPPANLRLVAEHLVAHPETRLATLALPATDEEFLRSDVTKVVCDLDGRALFFSRAAIPYPRNPRPGVARKHVGLYGFQREALFQFAAWPESELELVEGLEQLRALQHGMAIQVLAAVADSVAVDVPADVPRAEAALAALRQGPGLRAEGTGKRL